MRSVQLLGILWFALAAQAFAAGSDGGTPRTAGGPTPDACPPTNPNCGICGGTAPSCRMADGCNGHMVCQAGDWAGCVRDASGTTACQECGISGLQSCNASGPIPGTCVSTAGRNCTCGPYSGTRTCQGSGTWTECSGAWTGAVCVNGNQCGGTQACSGGTLLCNASGGTINAPACTSTLGFAGHNNCTAGGQRIGCQPDNSAQRYEVCNGLDDDADGFVDNAAGSTQASSFTQACTGTDNTCTVHGMKACVSGSLTTCQQCSGAFAQCSNGNTCGTTGSGQCTASCTLQANSCVVQEVQNNCDDDRNGIIDDGMNGSPCGL